jgi:predicted nucleic acid-binding protein
VIVLDASAVLDLLLTTERGALVAARIEDPGVGLHAPHLLDLEVAQVLRRRVAAGELSVGSAEQALDDLMAIDVERHAHEPLLRRVWHLRSNLTAYDAVYVALAEVLDCELLTCDARLARAPGVAARVVVID